MFAAPPELPMRVFTEIPPEDRRTGQPSDWFFGKDDPKAHSFLEGPAFDREGHLWVSDIPFGRLFRVSPEGRWTLALEYDGSRTASPSIVTAGASSPTTAGACWPSIPRRGG